MSVSGQAITLMGKLAPGPDYKIYLSRVGDVKTFDNFIVPVPAAVDPAAYNTVVIWCETFSEFITSAAYR